MIKNRITFFNKKLKKNFFYKIILPETFFYKILCFILIFQCAIGFNLCIFYWIYIEIFLANYYVLHFFEYMHINETSTSFWKCCCWSIWKYFPICIVFPIFFIYEFRPGANQPYDGVDTSFPYPDGKCFKLIYCFAGFIILLIFLYMFWYTIWYECTPFIIRLWGERILLIICIETLGFEKMGDYHEIIWTIIYYLSSNYIYFIPMPIITIKNYIGKKLWLS